MMTYVEYLEAVRDHLIADRAPQFICYSNDQVLEFVEGARQDHYDKLQGVINRVLERMQSELGKPFTMFSYYWAVKRMHGMYPGCNGIDPDLGRDARVRWLNTLIEMEERRG